MLCRMKYFSFFKCFLERHLRRAFLVKRQNVRKTPHLFISEFCTPSSQEETAGFRKLSEKETGEPRTLSLTTDGFMTAWNIGNLASLFQHTQNSLIIKSRQNHTWHKRHPQTDGHPRQSGCICPSACLQGIPWAIAHNSKMGRTLINKKCLLRWGTVSKCVLNSTLRVSNTDKNLPHFIFVTQTLPQNCPLIQGRASNSDPC